MKQQDELLAGIFLLVALGLLAISIFVLGRERQIFGAQYEYYTRFTNVKGLTQGAPVRLGGITVGRVSKIGFKEDFSDPAVYVTLLINDGFLERIREDTKATIETQGLLGDRFISIEAGRSSKQLLPGATLTSAEPADFAEVLQKASIVVDNTTEVSRILKETMAQIKSESLPDLNRAFKSIADISHEIAKGEGLLHRIIYNREDGKDILMNISRALRDIRSVTREVRTGKGLLHALVYDKKGTETVDKLSRSAVSLAEVSDNISAIAKEIREGEGILHEVIYTKSDKSLSKILTSLDEAVENINRTSKALAEGSGTLGALLVDSKLYDNLVEVTDGAKRSYILRQAIRSSLTKGTPSPSPEARPTARPEGAAEGKRAEQ